MSTLKSTGLRKSFDEKIIVHDISLQLSSGEIIGLLGPNGAGKTTTFYMIVGLIKSDKGRIHIDDKDITTEPIHKRFEHGISYLPQEPSIFRDMTAVDNINAVLEIDNSLNKSQRAEILDSLIHKFDLEKFLDTKGVQLSGGERRRVEIARALALKPKFLLLDEPFAGIDPIAVLDIQKIIKFLSSRGIGILITDHSVRETLGICNRAYIVNQGKIFTSGTPNEIVENENVKNIYLGQDFSL